MDRLAKEHMNKEVVRVELAAEWSQDVLRSIDVCGEGRQ